MMPTFPWLSNYVVLRLIPVFWLLIGFLNPAHAQDNTHNFVLSRTYKIPLKDAAVPVSVGEAILSLGYFDGLGRLQQTVNVQAGKDKKDIVAPVEYDAVGRLSKTYLPVSTTTLTGAFQPTAATMAVTYYNNSTRFAEPTDHVYAESQYETSPLNRVIGQINAGTTVSTTLAYGLNDLSVRNYLAGAGLTNITRNGYYSANQLTLTQSKDEEGKLLSEYKDKNGRLVLRRAASGQDQADTYYVYDDLDQLRAVIQPLYESITTPTPASDLPKYAFLYVYDSRGRLIQKQVPAGGLIQMQYNARDLLISSTDAKNQQFYFNYDALNRQTEMGVCIGTCDPTDPANTTNKNPLKYSYYDNYEALTPLSSVKLGDLVSGNFAFNNIYGLTAGSDFVPVDVRNANRKGQVTGECVRFLNADGSLSNLWNCSAIYYDDRYRVVQTVRTLPTMGSNGLERISYKRDYSGKVLNEKTTQSWNSQAYSLERTFTYDHAERLSSTRYSASSSDGTLAKDIYVNALTYNEIGQLTDKYIHATDATGSGAIEHLTYKNNVRGWLREYKGIQNGSRPYQITLGYQNNGNIASQAWQHPSMSQTKTYQFGYDPLNRMSYANEGLGGGLSEAPTYDLNGNIQTLSRRDAGGTLIDQLAYLYYGNNLLKSIGDATNNSAGFNNGYSGDDFNYDQNGNMVNDWNRNISLVDYNYLNLPRRVTISGKTLEYLYDAAGTKHSLTVGPTSQTLTSYEGAFEYNTSGMPTRISTDEGQLVKVGTAWQWQYYLKDHLGNVRVVLNEAGTVVQETEYYPFGLAIPKNPADLALSRAQNKYLYLNRELQEQTGWLDLKARFYDPTIGRFLSVDPMTESQEYLSPYHYGYDNPIRFSDPNGLMGDDPWYQKAWTAITNFWNSPVPQSAQATADGLTQAGLGTNANTIGDVITAAAIRFGEGYQYSNNLLSRGGLIPAGKSPTATVNLQTRANAIQNVQTNAIARNRSTVATAEIKKSDGTKQVVVSSSRDRLTPAQRAALQNGEKEVKGKGHAEATIVKHAEETGATVVRIAASRPVCENCQEVIKPTGATIESPIKNPVNKTN